VSVLLVEQKVDAALQVADRVSFLENGALRHERFLRSSQPTRSRCIAMSECAAEMAWIAGIDVGGTFTDLIALDSASGEVRLAKVPTTADNQAFGVLAALDEAKVPLAALGMLVHGTTTTTNALLERKLAKTGLITTRGFRDVLELGTPHPPQFVRPQGLVRAVDPRELRMEVPERMAAEGEEVTPLDERCSP
jgi:N-methylhydantoinase A